MTWASPGPVRSCDMRRLAVLSMHTSPLAQPGSGDGGGMNVYVRELCTALARSGTACVVFTRADAPGLAPEVTVEPGFAVRHVVAGPEAGVPKAALPGLVDAFADAVEASLLADEAAGEATPGAIHANYWLSGVAGHALKHRLDLPLVSTFHTLERVKAEASPEDAEPGGEARRAAAEAAVIGCSDALLASCTVEADDLVAHYGADRARIEVVAPGVDGAFFAPGDRGQARRALGLATEGRLLLFVGRIQPLKGADVAVRSLAALDERGLGGTRLLLVGGPSGPRGEEEVLALRALVGCLGLEERVSFVPPQPHEALSSFYRAADCCVVPSRSESFGLVALEAAACGIPVVASEVGGLATLVEDGRTGFLVPDGTVGSFADRLAAVLGDPSGAAAMGRAAAARARTYTWPIAAGRLGRLYDELTARTLVTCA